MWITNGCINCGVCAEICPLDAVAKENGVTSIKENVCINCGICIDYCPVHVILETRTSSEPPKTADTPSVSDIESLKECGRTPAKDILARAIIWGGYAGAKFVLFTLAVSAGLIDRSTAQGFAKITARLEPHEKKRLWKAYEETGSIMEIFNQL